MWYIIIVAMLAVSLYVAYRLTLFVDARLERQAKQGSTESNLNVNDAAQSDH